MDYRHHLRAVVAASAAPYGYTLTLWTAGAVAGFAAVGAFAFGGINGVLAPGTQGEIRVWGGLHLPSVGSSILLVWLISESVGGHLVWPVVGFTATATYLLIIGVQFWLATHRGHVPEPQEVDDPEG